MNTEPITIDNHRLLKFLMSEINQDNANVAKVATPKKTMFYWSIGKRINEEILKNERGRYGKQVIELFANSMSAQCGKGFSRTMVIRMIKFHKCFKDSQTALKLSQKLSWSHIKELLCIKDEKERIYYAYMAIKHNRSVRELRIDNYKIHKNFFNTVALIGEMNKKSFALSSL